MKDELSGERSCLEMKEDDRDVSGEEPEELEDGDGVSSRGGGISTIGLMVTMTQADATRLGGYLTICGHL